LDWYDKINSLTVYIPNATIDQYVLLLERFALIQELEEIVLKLDRNSQFCNDDSVNGQISILSLINQVKVKLPSLKKLKLTFREKDFKLITEFMKKKYIVQIANKAECSK
jgi:hypothetical protein